MRFNKILLVLMFLIIGNTSYALNQRPVRVTVEWSPFSLQTFITVNCDMFDSALDNIQIKSFEDNTSVKKFCRLLKSFKEESNIKSIDVRGRLTYYYRDRTEKYCFNKSGTFYQNGVFYSNKKLFNLIVDCIDEGDRYKLK